ncbi:MAG: GNAT family N-acetyltransferase [Clostridiales bacterium]|nr:GNAT family N-acetyltransferase [Clostridiales bacterium]
MKYFKKLVGDRIYLSPRSVDDYEKYAEWLNDFQVTDYTGRSSKILTREAEKEYLEKNTNVESVFAIVELETDKLLGSVGIENIDHINRSGTLGIFIGDKDYRSKGYGTEAIRLVLEYGFKYLNLKNINLDVLACNERAIKCYEKCGFKEYGRRRKCKFVNGVYYDVINMDILDEEFEGKFIRNKNV